MRRLYLVFRFYLILEKVERFSLYLNKINVDFMCVTGFETVFNDLRTTAMTWAQGTISYYFAIHNNFFWVQKVHQLCLYTHSLLFFCLQ